MTVCGNSSLRSGVCVPSGFKKVSSLAGCLVVLLGLACAGQAWAAWPHVVSSSDGTPIAYEVYGAGEPTLVFVHGWSCDARYWRAQVPVFSGNYQVVICDLAGHGHSGTGRKAYTMAAFGEDVRAVAEATGSHRVILIGHSMGGTVIAEAARLMPEQVIGLIGIDTLENIEYPMTPEELEGMVAPLAKDFQAGSRQFVSQMALSTSDSSIWKLSMGACSSTTWNRPSVPAERRAGVIEP